VNLFVSVLKGFKRRKANLLFPVLGVALGVMLVVLVSSVGAVGKAAVSKEISSLGLGGLMISAEDGGFLGGGELECIRNTPMLDKATPIIYTYSQVQCANDQSDCILWGIDDYSDDIMNISVFYGRQITKSDLIAHKNVCLVDASYAKKTHGRENIIGKTVSLSINAEDIEFTIVGVTDSGKSLVKNIVSDYIPCLVYVPYTVLRVVGGEDQFSAIAANVKESVDFNRAETAVVNKLYEYGTQNSSYKIENMFNYTQTIDRILDIITLVLSGIAAISLVVSGMSVMTVMLFSVGERTHEIGIKKAIGASFFDILFEFLLESVIITVIGCLLGTAIGTTLSFVLCKAFSLYPIFDSRMIVICITVTALFGLLFGIYPATRAARLNPAVALRQK